MNPPLRIGIAGLGTVGAALCRLMERQGNELAMRCGRPVARPGVSARDRRKERGLNLTAATWFDDPVALARDPGNEVFVELIGGADGAAEASVRAGLAAGQNVVAANKGLLSRHGQAPAANVQNDENHLKISTAHAHRAL